MTRSRQKKYAQRFFRIFELANNRFSLCSSPTQTPSSTQPSLAFSCLFMRSYNTYGQLRHTVFRTFSIIEQEQTWRSDAVGHLSNPLL